MPKNKPADRENADKGGYRPLNDGYSPTGKKGYVPKAPSGGLPKAPAGGTGQTSPNRPPRGGSGTKQTSPPG